MVPTDVRISYGPTTACSVPAGTRVACSIVVFFSDHGEQLGAHGGMHEKWHNAYDESTHVPFIVASPLIKGPRTIDIPI